MNLTSLQNQLCNIQGKLFELSCRKGIDSDAFVRAFMLSDTAAHFDLPYDRTQWCGEEYLLEELEDDSGGLPRAEYIYDPEAMFWMGYLYRYWHFYTNESSKEIYKYANAAKMSLIYPGYHTLDCQEAIDRLLESVE